MVVGGHSIIGKLIDANQQSEKGRGTEWEQTCIQGGNHCEVDLNFVGKFSKWTKGRG